MTKIVAIDDSSWTRRMLRGIIEGAEHEVLDATGRLSALELYSLEQPEIVFLDLTMPGMRSGKSCEELFRIDPRARIAAAIADAATPTRRRAEEQAPAALSTRIPSRVPC